MPQPFTVVLGEPLGEWSSLTPTSVPATCLALAQLSEQHAPGHGLFLIVRGENAHILPAIALAQRSAHRRVWGYLLVDADPPASTDSWPDAPVVAFTSDPEVRPVSLRGWPMRAYHDTKELVALLESEMQLLLE